ncbi:DeoR/GlpR family DNA-binding transcription regulator [Falsihalocynthiibacter sp. SS001]|uniref:DeoR/GlpR family DNA-binding transcription regulator n=1 Tax=Falsihalocynthiibacter sp. SS001 TaxID=3349698 RepID=UPI0036D25968
MLMSERHAIILKELEQHPTISIRTLTTSLGVSRETIRKDIELLAQENKLKQVRGGATQVRTREFPMARRSQLNMNGKDRIASCIADQIPNGISLILDNGSSVLAVARALSGHQDLIVYTNDLRVAEVIAPATRELTVLGGRVDPAEMAVFGIEALEHLNRYRADFAIVSAGGLSSDAFLTDFNREASGLRHQMLCNAQTGFVLADSSKFEAVGHVLFPPVPKGTRIVTDEEPSAAIRRCVSQNGVELLIAHE